jgi:4'-phosphopantetheinyl transferase
MSASACALLDRDTVHVVALSLDLLEADLDLLDADERQRAARFATPQLQRRFIAAHSGLRRLLGWALAEPPAVLRFGTDSLGKPHLQGRPERHFSLSHCGGQGLVAIGPAPLGIDLEALIQRDTELLAERILSPAELGRWRLRPQIDRTEALTEAWTQKEALLKACGLGLRVDPISLEIGEGPQVSLDGRFYDLQRLQAAPGHCAALAQALPARPLRGWRLLSAARLEPMEIHLPQAGNGAPCAA